MFSPDGTLISASAAPNCGGLGKEDRQTDRHRERQTERERERERGRERERELVS